MTPALLSRRLLTGRAASGLLFMLIAGSYAAIFVEGRYILTGAGTPFNQFVLPALIILGTIVTALATLGWTAANTVRSQVLCAGAQLVCVGLTLMLVRDSGLRYSVLLVPSIVQVVALPPVWRLVLGGGLLGGTLALTQYFYTLEYALDDILGRLLSLGIVTAFVWLLLREHEMLAQAEYVFRAVRRANLNIRQTLDDEAAQERQKNTLIQAAARLIDAGDMRALLRDLPGLTRPVIDALHVQLFLRHADGHLYLAFPTSKRLGAGTVFAHEYLALYQNLMAAGSIHVEHNVRDANPIAQSIAIVDLLLFGIAHFAQVQSWMAVPLVHDEQGLGLLIFEHGTRGTYNQSQVQEIAGQLGIWLAAAIHRLQDMSHLGEIAAQAERARLLAMFNEGMTSILARMADPATPPDHHSRLAQGALAEFALRIGNTPQSWLLYFEQIAAAADARSGVRFTLITQISGEPPPLIAFAAARLFDQIACRITLHADAGEVTAHLIAHSDHLLLMLTDEAIPRPGHERADRIGVADLQQHSKAAGLGFVIRTPATGNHVICELKWPPGT